ncbi:MAG: Sterol desaturase/sphingolipid hydroxylase, fatty acid hydroxylase superfamily, partial [Pseudomonadota bacterium]|nr:Sterol desaturase/sphingolipid hydroxylase, fatty acid hydroxylase superfamily [Pseudomonadota bacterium]
AGYTGWLFAFVYEHRLFTLSPLVWWTWVLLFFADDFTYYWYHRSAHRCRLFWMEHVNHHSSEHYNLSTALRQSTLGPAYTFVFYLPLAFVGFHPLAIAVQFGISLIYQYWIHTEAIDRLGFLEKFMNTPSHHRGHHGSNGIYIDKNYAGILIIWDKLFGTFQEERRDVPVKYGLVHDLKTFSLPTVIFHETAFMLRQVWNAKGWRNKLGWIFGPPEWSPDGPQYPPDHPYWQTQAATKAS